MLSLGATAIVLVIFSYFSMKAVEEHASSFLLGYAASLARAGVHAQSLIDIDKEVARFVVTWKETQDLDARIEIFIDGKLIARGGQLQPFKYLHTNVKSNFHLPSGQTMTAHLQISLKEFVILRFVELLVFEIFVFLVYLLLVKKIKCSIAKVTSPLEQQVMWLKDLASHIQQGIYFNTEFDKTEILEINELADSVHIFMAEIENLKSSIEKISFDRGRIETAENVAHNIKGAVSTLQMKIGANKVLSDIEKKELLDCVKSVRDVSTNLLKARRSEQNEKLRLQPRQQVNLVDPVRAAFELKQMQYQSHKKVKLDFSDVNKLDGIFLTTDASEFQSVISNLIENAFEALPSKIGTIQLKVALSSSVVEIIITDNGQGIAEDILQKINSIGGTYGKKNGTGIGLKHAKGILSSASGKIEIHSTLEKGTSVSLLIPREDLKNLAKEIKIRNGASICIIDDDPLIHEVWRMKLEVAQLQSINAFFFFNPEQFNSWMGKNGHGDFGSRQYFFDYDLKDKNANGLDLIERYGLALESMLISGMAKEAEVLVRAKKLSVAVMDKELLGLAPIKIEKTFNLEPTGSTGLLCE